MPNRFNTPIQSKPTMNYTSQFVGLPLEEIEASLQASQNQYDAVEALGISKKSELAGIEAHGQWADQILGSKRKELDDFTSQFDGKDLASREVSTAFKQKISDLSSDPDINRIVGFNQKYKQFQANLEKMKESGDYTPENIWQHQKALQNYAQTGDDSGFDSVIEKGVNINEEAEKYYKALHANSAEVMRSIADGQGGSIYYDNKSGGISGNQIKQQATRMLDEFQASAAGRQAMRRYQMEVEMNGGKATNAGAQQYLAKVLLDAGAGMQYSESSSGLSAALNAKGALDRKKKEDKKAKEEEMLSLPFTTISTLVPNMKVEAGKIVGEGGSIEAFKQAYAQTGSIKSALKEFKDVAFGNKANPLSESQRKAFAPTLDSFTQINKMRSKNGEKPYELDQWLKAVQGGSKQQQITLNVPLKKQTQDAWNNLLVANRGIMGMTVVDPKDPTKTLTGEQAIRIALDKDADDELTQDEIKDAVQVIGGSNNTGYALNGVGVSIGGKPFLGDMGSSKLLPGYQAESQEDAQSINAFGIQQAKLKMGTHEFWGYDNQMNKIRVKAIANPITGEVKTIQQKAK